MLYILEASHTPTSQAQPDSELSGLSGHERRVRSIWLAPVSQPHCLRQAGAEVDPAAHPLYDLVLNGCLFCLTVRFNSVYLGV